MDVKNMRLMDVYSDADDALDVLYIDDEARKAVDRDWGEEVEVIGRRNVSAVIRQLQDFDLGACVARAGSGLREKLMIEVGEEVLINSED